MASLTSQNRALQADLVDKNRYIAVLEKRLLQARRASQSRTSVGLTSPNKTIMVGEDHSVSALLKDKDAEIAELRARLDDKDRMLGALRSAARSRDNADRVDSRAEIRTSVLLTETASSPVPTSPLPSPPAAAAVARFSQNRKRTRSIDEMSRILDEMIQDRVETGQIVRGVRGSVRVASDGRKLESLAEPVEALGQASPMMGESAKAVALEV
jgi:centromeric protein E